MTPVATDLCNVASSLKEGLAHLPELPGVYRMMGVGGEILYVGKAKNLKRRVASYFQRSIASPRIALMVASVERVEVTVTASEAEALIVENNLIKRHAPRFNVLFRDDKSYPYLRITDEAFGRITYYRGSTTAPGRYFGPFPNAYAARETVALLQRIFRLRTCEDSVFRNRTRPCLQHQIGRCTAPCVGLIAAEDYAADLRMAILFLEGKTNEIQNALRALMEAAAKRMAFEQAAAYRDQIRALQKVLHKQYGDSARDEDVDIIAVASAGERLCVNHAMVRGGRHLGDHAHFPTQGNAATAEEALLAFLGQHYATHPAPPRILLDRLLPEDDAVSVRGPDGKPAALILASHERERAWLALARQNADLALARRRLETDRGNLGLDAVQQVFGLAEPPRRIEGYDVSHTQGEATVASRVVWVDGRPAVAEYRRYNIRGVAPGDDYAAMRQVLARRFTKLEQGEGERPQLVLIDGGIGQLNVAQQVLADLGIQDIPLVGVAKGPERKPGLELLLPAEGAPIRLPAEHPALHLIQAVRDEAHRFAITGHRARRARSRAQSGLEEVAGIGPARRRLLLAHFGGVQGVSGATIDDLCRVPGIGRGLAEAIHRQLH
ncbi:MAG: UvrABC system protein C [Betaproteobacteria bacterium]